MTCLAKNLRCHREKNLVARTCFKKTREEVLTDLIVIEIEN